MSDKNKLNMDLIRAETEVETKELLRRGANPNAKDDYGKTALMLAKTVGQMKLLIDAGANIYAVDVDGSKAIHRYYDKIDCLKYIISKGADIESENIYGHRVLHLACANVYNNDGNLEVIRFLLENSVDHKSPDKFGYNGKQYARNDKSILAIFDEFKY